MVWAINGHQFQVVYLLIYLFFFKWSSGIHKPWSEWSADILHFCGLLTYPMRNLHQPPPVLHAAAAPPVASALASFCLSAAAMPPPSWLIPQLAMMVLWVKIIRLVLWGKSMIFSWKTMFLFFWYSIFRQVLFFGSIGQWKQMSERKSHTLR